MTTTTATSSSHKFRAAVYCEVGNLGWAGLGRHQFYFENMPTDQEIKNLLATARQYAKAEGFRNARKVSVVVRDFDGFKVQYVEARN